jgi:tRNA-(ms[2]io[6]A)-hydroxylase
VSSAGVELAWTTPPGWGAAASRQPLALLVDHAHCELQAAVACQSLIARYPDRPVLVDRAAEVAREELEHFQRVVALLRELGGELGDGGPNPYAEGLRKASAPSRRHGLLDRLLLAAVIERRSCERFELLAADAEQPALRALYRELAPQEVRHQGLFLELARQEVGVAEAEERLAVLVATEAQVIAGLAFAPRMHSGAPA